MLQLATTLAPPLKSAGPFLSSRPARAAFSFALEARNLKSRIIL